MSPRPLGSDPLVSVLCFVYNRERFIEQTIRSVLDQSHRNLELVLLDDGSTDSTPEIVRALSLDPRIRYHRQENIGRFGDFHLLNNRCVERACGDLISWIGADDVYATEKTARQVAEFLDDPGLDVSFTDGRHIDAQGHVIPGNFRHPESVSHTPGNHLRNMYRRDFIAQPSVMMRRESFIRGGWMEMGFAADYHFWMKTAKTHTYRYLDEKLLDYRIHDDGVSTGPGNRGHEEGIKVRRHIRGTLAIEDFYPELDGLGDRRRGLADAHFDLGLRSLGVYVDHAAALDDFDRSLSAADSDEARFNLAVLQLATGSHAEAEANFRRLAERPDLAEPTRSALADLVSGKGVRIVEMAPGRSPLLAAMASRETADLQGKKASRPHAAPKPAAGAGSTGLPAPGKLRVVYHLQNGAVSTSGGMAGVETASLATCRELASRGHEVLLVAQAPTATAREGTLSILPDVQENLQIIQSRIDEADSFVATSHARSFFRFRLPAAARRIVHFHHADLQYTIGTESEKRSVFGGGGCDAVLCVSDFSRRAVLRHGVPPGIAEVVHNGFDPEVFRPEPGAGRDPFLILFAGAFMEHKGPDVAVEAVAELRRRGHPCRLRLVGSADMYGGHDPWFDAARVRRDNPWVEFAGQLGREAMRGEYSRAGFVLCPSRIESFGMVSVEAQACGCIPVVAPTGGLPETLSPGVTGIVVAANEPGAFADAVAGLLADPARMERMGREATERAPTTYSWRKVADRIESASRPVQVAAPSGGEPPLVSIVVPTYEQAPFLEECLESILAQTHPRLEVLVVDDGSPDESVAIAEAFGRRHPSLDLKVLRKQNGGVSSARNHAIALARGKYLLPLDADDLILPQTVAELVAALEGDPRASIASPDFQAFGEARWSEDGGPLGPAILGRNNLPYCSLYRRDVWESVGGYRENMRGGYEDWDFWVACHSRGIRGIRVPRQLFRYRVKKRSRATDAFARDAELKASIVANNRETFPQDRRTESCQILSERAAEAISSGQFRLAAERLELALRIAPEEGGIRNGIQVALSRLPRSPAGPRPAADPQVVRAIDDANALFEKGRAPEALELLLDLEHRVPPSKILVNAVAWLQLQTENVQAAHATYLKATVLWPSDPDVHANLAGIRIRIGAPERAVQSLRKVLELRPGDPDATLALNRIEGTNP